MSGNFSEDVVEIRDDGAYRGLVMSSSSGTW